MDVERWDPVRDNNNEAPPDGAPENMLRSGLNNCIREVMAAVKRVFEAAEYLNQVYGYTVSKYGPRVVQIADVDVRGYFPVGKRVRVSTDGVTWYYGFVASNSMPGAHTLVTVDMDPNLGYGELASGIQLTFADADPDTITAASGTPFSSLVDGDQVRVRLTENNDGIVEVESATGTEITLDAGETLTAEADVDAKIYQESGIVPDSIDRIQCATTDVGRASARDVGITASDVPSVSHLEPHVFKPEGAGGAMDADTVDGEHADDIVDTAAVARNLLVNSDFMRWQEGVSWASPDNTDGVYFADQWVALYEGASDTIDIAKVTSGLPADCLAGVSLTWNSASEKAGIYQMVERMDSAPVLGESKYASLTFRVKGVTSYPVRVRALILSWTGTADDIDADWISAWPSSPADPTPIGSFTIEGSGSLTLDGTWQTFTLENVAIDAVGAENVGIFIWSDDDSISISDRIDIARVRLAPGVRAIDLDPEPAADLFARTWRYFWKTFEEDSAPAHNSDANSAPRWISDYNGVNWLNIWLPIPMLKSPTAAYYNPYNATPGSSYVRDLTTPFNLSVATDRLRKHWIRIASSASLNFREMTVHIVLSARFF